MKLNIYVCEAFAKDYEAVVKKEQYEDVNIVRFPCFCSNKSLLKKGYKLPVDEKGGSSIILAGTHCDALKLVEKQELNFQIKKSEYCFSHLINEQIIEFIIESGGYIVTNGWLEHWRQRLKGDGFDRETAQKFFGDFCTQIVLLDTGIYKESEEKLNEFSEYIDIPSKKLDIGLEGLSIFVQSMVYEWRLKSNRAELNDYMKEMRRFTSEYSALLNIIGQIATYNQKRDIIDKMKEVFQSIFGAQSIRYIDKSGNMEHIEEVYGEFVADKNLNYISSKENNELIMKIATEDELFGILEIKDFLFPNYISKYTNFAESIGKVAALVFSNAKQFELLEKTKNEVSYNSYHDSLTGLYNRNYYNKYIAEEKLDSGTAIFMCDVDGLKRVNDTYGHISGDELICMAAEVLKESFRELDIVARIGGDEFCVIQFNVNEKIAKETKERIQNIIDKKNMENKTKLFELSISVGYVVTGEKNNTWENILNKADEIMYAEKTLKKQQREV